jgi:hypothetical protein
MNLLKIAIPLFVVSTLPTPASSKLSVLRAQADSDAGPVQIVQSHDLPEREEIRREVPLSPGASVEVQTVSGPVTVETSDSSSAEIFIVRSAQTRAELDCYTTLVEASPSSIIIRHQQHSRSGCSSIRARQRIWLKLPRQVDLKLSTISGDVKVGPISGELRLQSISGRVDLMQPGGYSQISSISGALKVMLGSVDERGIHISSISGSVELVIPEGLDADLKLDDINGFVKSELPGVTINKVGTSNYRARIGSGGHTISVFSLTGNVKVSGA